jgi:hypothetical protein
LRLPDAVIGKELEAYYQARTAPAWAVAIKNLSAEKTEQRTSAGKYHE